MWGDELDKDSGWPTPAQWRLVAIVAACALGGAIYHRLWRWGLGTTSAMFIGLPVVLAILLALTPKAKSAKGATVKGIAIVLLAAAPLAGEGYLCILFASPLFFLVGLAIAAGVDAERRDQGRLRAWAWLALLPMALEGVTPTLSFPRNESVTSVRIVRGSPADVKRELGAGLRPETPLPLFLRIGFPRPLAVQGTGLAVDDMRRIHFSGAESDGPGDLVLRVAKSGPGYLRFERVSDDSHLRQWMAWEVSEVRWREVSPGRTEVRWTIQFARRLDPAWYFGLWERFAVKQAADYLIAADAEPR
ncbi:MAG: hypothetical protein JF584_03585 [Acidobacteria bacterium]|nr:hypothetical protein [Acidobacteriota bacterium]